MYLYFNNEGKLQTAIAHGNPIRQTDSFGLYVCFDLDYFKNNSLINGSELLYMTYKRPSDTRFAPLGTPLELKGSVKFIKTTDSEVTYKLKDGQRYITYYAYINSNAEITNESGDLNLVFCFQKSEGVEYVLDVTTGYYRLSGSENTENVINLSAKLYVEPTYNKAVPQMDGSIDLDDYNRLINLIGTVSNEKNVALIDMNFNNYGEEPTDKYATLLARANYIFSTWVNTRIGWLLVGKKNEITLDSQEQEQTDVVKMELYLISDENNMFIIDVETGIMYNYDNTQVQENHKITQLTYNKIYFDDLFGAIETFLTTHSYPNLTSALVDYYDRIGNIETNAIYDVKYDDDMIEKKIGKDGTYTKVISKNELRDILNINNIESHGAFDLKYEDNTLKVKNGYSAANYTNLFTANSLKADMNLDLVDNKASEDVVSNTSNFVATLKAVHDALENPNASVLPEYASLKAKVEAIANYIEVSGEDGDAIINKINEIVAAFAGMPEELDLMDWLNNIYDKIGEERTDTFFYDESIPAAERSQYTIKGRITRLEENANHSVLNIMRYADNQELFTLVNWQQLTIHNQDYPQAVYYTEIQSDAFKDALDIEIVFNRNEEQRYILGSDLETTTGVITLYALEEPSEPLTIDTIKMISSLYHTNSLSLDALRQIELNKDNITSNTNSIGNINAQLVTINNELPQFVKTTKDYNENSSHVHYHIGYNDNAKTFSIDSSASGTLTENVYYERNSYINFGGGYMFLVQKTGDPLTRAYTEKEISFGDNSIRFKIYGEDGNANETANHSLILNANGNLTLDGVEILQKEYSYGENNSKITIEKTNDNKLKLHNSNKDDLTSSDIEQEIVIGTNDIVITRTNEIDASNTKSVTITINDDGVEVLTDKVAGIAGIQHSLLFDLDGNLKVDGQNVGGGKQLYNNFIKITYNNIISAIVKVDSDRSDFLNGNDRALWDYLNYYGFTSADNFYPCSGINTNNNNVIYGVYAAWNSSRTARLYGMIGSVGSELFFYTGTTQISYIAL